MDAGVLHPYGKCDATNYNQHSTYDIPDNRSVCLLFASHVRAYAWQKNEAPEIQLMANTKSKYMLVGRIMHGRSSIGSYVTIDGDTFNISSIMSRVSILFVLFRKTLSLRHSSLFCEIPFELFCSKLATKQ